MRLATAQARAVFLRQPTFLPRRPAGTQWSRLSFLSGFPNLSKQTCLTFQKIPILQYRLSSTLSGTEAGSVVASIPSQLHTENAAEIAQSPEIETIANETAQAESQPPIRRELLPFSCPGCGALSQTVEPEEAGYYRLTRKGVRAYLKDMAELEEQAERDAEKKKEAEETEGSDFAEIPKDAVLDGVTASGVEEEPQNHLDEASAQSDKQVARDQPEPEETAEKTAEEEAETEAGAEENDANEPQSFSQSPPPNLSPEEKAAFIKAQIDASRAERTKLNGVPTPPVCERCHNLTNYSRGQSIYHPSIKSLAETIAESPHKRDHIYHVIDAADFPMSLIPNIHKHLAVASPRTQNRRSKDQRWHRGKNTEISFIITRSDLLAPKKDQVDRMMPYLMDVLRDALGYVGNRIRLGNLHCVSAKRGWWTRKIKDMVSERGGGNWLVGKVNVGKSNLFEVIFPKGGGRVASASSEPPKPRDPVGSEAEGEGDPEAGSQALNDRRDNRDETAEEREEREAWEEWAARKAEDEPEAPIDPADALEKMKLLPPAQPYVPYPVMPIISPLPGTTASPIRVPFGPATGKARGELIDLPGLERSTLETHVLPEFRSELVMQHRVSPERVSIKPGQSLLLGGGLVRITPRTPDLVFLSASFVPAALKPHVTSTTKAEEVEAGLRQMGIARIVSPAGLAAVKSAGRFKLRWDVTKMNAGPLTRKDDVGLKPEKLPFRIMSADVLIEGVGWVEVTAEIRKRQIRERVEAMVREREAEEAEKKELEAAEEAAKAEEGPDLKPQDEAEASSPSSPDILSSATSPVTSVPTESEPTAESGASCPNGSEKDPNLVLYTPLAPPPADGSAQQSGSSTAAAPKSESRLALERELELSLLPEIEVFTPLGKYVGIRRPMNGYELGGKKKLPKHLRMSRPRESMRSIKGRRAPGTPTGVSSKDSPLRR